MENDKIIKEMLEEEFDKEVIKYAKKIPSFIERCMEKARKDEK